MIDLHTYRTANGRKASIMLEEVGLPYAVHVVDITVGEQHVPAFRAVSPNGRIPAIVDRDGPGGAPFAVFESGAILLYLADKTGKLLPRDPAARWRAVQWLMFQMGGVGPMFGQAFHFRHQAPDGAPADAVATGRARYDAAVLRLCAVLDRALETGPYLAGDYSVADVATYPWVALRGWLGIDLARFPRLARWHDAVAARPAVARGMNVPARAP
ncbi:MAG: glutathione S-transferase family protein [Rhodospirillaceae bacterium]